MRSCRQNDRPALPPPSCRRVGIVSIGDVVKHRLEQIEHEYQAIREYIATA